MTRKSDNQFWLNRLRSVAGLQDCEFPSGLELFGQSSDVEMHLIPEAVSDNMQEDHAAFEAWCLALQVHCQVEQIQIDLLSDTAVLGVHPNRFKYRLRTMRELFPKLISIKPKSAWLSEPLTEGGELKINKSYPRKSPPDLEPSAAMERAKDGTESQLEFGLEVSWAFRQAFGLTTVMRQWPIGVFQNAVKRANELLPRSKSAIDLIAVGDDEAPLFLFELKKADNRKAGIVGELLFYTAVMRDVLQRTITYEDDRAARNCALSPSDILARQSIVSVFITNGRHHPLVEQGAIVTALNQATRAAWVQKPASFRSAKVTHVPTASGDDFKFIA